MGKIIGLIACSSTKLGKDSPAKKYLAKDIYKGHTFILSKDEGLKKYKCEEWYILSGKYGLLDRDNNYPCAKEIKKELTRLRKIGKNMTVSER